MVRISCIHSRFCFFATAVVVASLAAFVVRLYAREKEKVFVFSPLSVMKSETSNIEARANCCTCLIWSCLDPISPYLGCRFFTDVLKDVLEACIGTGYVPYFSPPPLPRQHVKVQYCNIIVVLDKGLYRC